MTKKQTNLILGIIILIISVFALVFSEDSSKYVSFGDESVEPADDVYEKEVIAASVSESLSPGANLAISETPIQSVEENLDEVSEEYEVKGYEVVKVVDGDTIDIDIDGKIERLRLIGIDTPETVDPRREIQCFGIEASNKAKELLNGQFVTLESDESQGDRDKYKRLLRYVILADGSNFNLYMVREGYAHEYTYDEAYKYQAEFKSAEEDARNNLKGLWSPQTCSGNK